jgi:hypothetical protein
MKKFSKNSECTPLNFKEWGVFTEFGAISMRSQLSLSFLLLALIVPLSQAGLIRCAHGSPDGTSLDIFFDGFLFFSNVAFRDVTNYVHIGAGSHRITATPSGAQYPVLINTTWSFDLLTPYTFLVTGISETVKQLILKVELRMHLLGYFKMIHELRIMVKQLFDLFI